MIAIVTKYGTTDAFEAGDDMLKAMLEAQSNLGSTITWTHLSEDVARGVFTSTGGDKLRVVVADLMVTSAREALELASWVNGMIAD